MRLEPGPQRFLIVENPLWPTAFKSTLMDVLFNELQVNISLL
jgi:hypothetical protein